MLQKNKIQRITIGNAVFKNIPHSKKTMIQKQQRVLSMLKDNYWGIGPIWKGGNYLQLKYQQIFYYMIECSATGLFIATYKRSQIISQIQHISFINLRRLNLARNRINNIQAISLMHFQCLQRLDLEKNEINEIKSMSKLSIAILNIIQLFQNPILEIHASNRSKIDPNWLKLLHLNYTYNVDFSKQKEEHQIQQDLSVLVKLNCKSFQQIKYSQRIIQEKVYSMLKFRFSSLEIPQILI